MEQFQTVCFMSKVSPKSSVSLETEFQSDGDVIGVFICSRIKKDESRGKKMSR